MEQKTTNTEQVTDLSQNKEIPQETEQTTNVSKVTKQDSAYREKKPEATKITKGFKSNRAYMTKRQEGDRDSRFRKRRRILDARKVTIDYKKSDILERFISKTGKILPRKITGASALLQRKIAREIKRARHIGLLPYAKR